MDTNWRRSLLALGATLMVACGGGDGGTTGPGGDSPPVVATVTVTLPIAQLVQGTTAMASVEVRSSSGALLSGRSLAWNSSTPTVATVDASGLIRGIAPGNTTISVTTEGKTGSVVLTVVPPPVATVVIFGASGALATGERRQLTATTRDANNVVLTDRLIVWASSNQTIASVSASGEVTALSPGTATITATSEGRSGTYVLATVSAVATVTITGTTRVKVGDTYTYVVTARRADGTVIVRPMVWSVKQPAMGTITSTGALTPLQPGTLTLQVEIDGAFWVADYTVYDWELFAIGGSTFASLEADNLIVNKFGRSEYARLVFDCSSAGYFFSWVSTQNFVTQSGLVALSFDGGTPFTQTWDESDDFNTLFRPGNNLSVKSFAVQVASARLFGFAFTEFQASAKAMIFRVTGLAQRLQPMLTQCPSNSLLVAADMTDAESFAQHKQNAVAQFNTFTSGAVEVDAALKALRVRRGTVGATGSVAPIVGVAPASITVTEQPMRRR